MGHLDGQHALVTGAGSGIGRAIALALAGDGARIAVEDLEGAKAAATLAEIGGRGIALEGDVADPAAVKGWFAQIRRQFGQLEILVNNAGHVDPRREAQGRIPKIAEELASGAGQSTPLDATIGLSDEQWSRMLAVHLNGTFYCTREALKLMQPARYGRIVNVASIAATTGVALAPHYSAAKGGVAAFTKAVAREVVGLGITVNAIAPGYVDTPLLDCLTEPTRAMVLAGIPMGRLGTAEEIVPAALLLVDPRNRFMTGQVISPNGGEVI